MHINCFIAIRVTHIWNVQIGERTLRKLVPTFCDEQFSTKSGKAENRMPNGATQKCCSCKWNWFASCLCCATALIRPTAEREIHRAIVDIVAVVRSVAMRFIYVVQCWMILVWLLMYSTSSIFTLSLYLSAALRRFQSIFRFFFLSFFTISKSNGIGKENDDIISIIGLYANMLNN